MSDIPTFVCVSGGRTSGYMAYLLKDEPNHHFIFQNTGRERPETYDFLHALDFMYKLNLVWLEYSCPDPKQAATFNIVDYKTANRTGKPFEELNVKRRAIPNKFKRFCTIEMKVKTARRYIRSLGYKKWNYALGYRSDEPLRVARSDNMQNAITPLRDRNVTLHDVKHFWKEEAPFDLDLPMLPNGKTFGGNCMGCFFHSEYQNAHLCKTRPQDAQWLIEQEERFGHTFNENYSFKELANQPPDLLDQAEHYCLEPNGSCFD